jgi:hypothetical protein
VTPPAVVCGAELKSAGSSRGSDPVIWREGILANIFRVHDVDETRRFVKDFAFGRLLVSPLLPAPASSTDLRPGIKEERLS